MTNKSKIFPEKAPNLHITFVLCEYKNKIKHIFFQVFTMIFVTDGVTICNLLLSIVYKNPLLLINLNSVFSINRLGPSSFVRCRWVVSISLKRWNIWQKKQRFSPMSKKTIKYWRIPTVTTQIVWFLWPTVENPKLISLLSYMTKEYLA